jgi:hypothetical protein
MSTARSRLGRLGAYRHPPAIVSSHPLKSSAGPNPTRSVAQGLLSCSIGLALISILCSIRSASGPRSTKLGTVVVNALTGFGAERQCPFGAALCSLSGGYVTGVL